MVCPECAFVIVLHYQIVQIGYLDNTNIWGTFWSKYGYLTPWGAHISGYPPFFAIYFEEIVSRFVLNVTFLIFRIFERSEMSKNDYFDYFLVEN